MAVTCENIAPPENSGSTSANLFSFTATVPWSSFYAIRIYFDGAVENQFEMFLNKGADNYSFGAQTATWASWGNESSHTRKVEIWTTGYLAKLAESSVWNFTILKEGLAKPTTPSPANASGPGIDFSARTLSWVNGGGAINYTVRIGPYPLATNVVSLEQTDTSYVIPESAIALYKNNPIAWRVDASDGSETVTGDTWTFDPRPAKATTPSPTNEAIDQSPNLASLSWVSDAYNDKSEVACSWAGTVDPIAVAADSLTLGDYTPVYLDHLGHNETYTWRVDTVNAWGTTEGDTWQFTTLSLDPPMPSWELIVGGSGYGPLEGGVEGVDFRWLGNNFGTAVKRLVAAARNRIFYEDV